MAAEFGLKGPWIKGLAFSSPCQSNVRAEMEGLEPAYYTDAGHARADLDTRVGQNKEFMTKTTAQPSLKVLQATGIPGLDEILGGGLVPSRVYLIEGKPGSGKTTLALQWLMAGIAAGEAGLYVSLAETREELEEVVHSHGWDIGKITVCEAVIPEEMLKPEEQFTVFQPTDMQLNETTRQMLEQVEKVKPQRVVIDSLSEMRVLAQNAYRHRQQVVALKRFLTKHKCTVLMLDDAGGESQDVHLQTAAHGVIVLQQVPMEYGSERRRLRIVKMRGKQFALGYHDFLIRPGGLEVFPRLLTARVSGSFDHARLKSGIAELDALMGGGPRRGTSTLIIGPAGTGKSTIAQQFAVAAANRGERAALFIFEESIATMLARTEALSLGLRPHIESGRIAVVPIDPGQVSPGEFASRIRRSVEEPGGERATVLVIDSLNGYLNAMPEERFLIVQLHEILTYLAQEGVASFLVLALRGIVGSNIEAPVETTYLADNAIVMRFFEAAGEMKLALAVPKMRSASNERTIREMRIGPQGLHIGEPLHQFQGVLTGEPIFLGGTGPLLKEK